MLRRAPRALLAPFLVSTLAGCPSPPPPAAHAPMTSPETRYDTRVPATENIHRDDTIHQAVFDATRAAGLQRDPRLDRVAGRVLGSGPVRAPQASVLDALMREQGLVEPVPLLKAMAGTESGVADMLAEETRTTLARRQPTHYGLAVRSGPKGAAAVLVLSTRRLSLEPVPRSVAVGTPLRLRGELAEGLRAPGWVVTPPQGDVQRLPPTAEGKAFDLELPLPLRGAYRIELVAEGSDGVQVVANFPVWSGVSPPAVQTESRTEGGASVDAASVEARLRELIRRERQRAERAPLSRDAALDAVALAHTRDMATHDFVAHESPRTGSPTDRVQAAGLSAWLVRENLGRGYSAEEIHTGLMQSPGHRDNILSADAESLGLAVVQIDDEPRDAFLATQLFASLSKPVDAAAVRREVLSHIARERQQAGMQPTRESAQLMRIAQAAAERYLREPVDRKAVLQQAMAEAELPPGTQQLGASLVVLYGLGQLGDHALGLEPRAKALGVGLAQGQRADTPPHALAVVVLFAQ